MQINRTTDYALRFLYYLGSEHRVVSSQEMAKRMNISRRYLLRIANVLKNHGFIGASMGADGGYSLLQPMDKITFYDVLSTMEGKMILSRCCLQHNEPFKDEPCIFHDAYGFLQGILDRYLQSLTLDMLINQPVNEWHSNIMKKLYAMYCQRTGTRPITEEEIKTLESGI